MRFTCFTYLTVQKLPIDPRIADPLKWLQSLAAQFDLWQLEASRMNRNSGRICRMPQPMPKRVPKALGRSATLHMKMNRVLTRHIYIYVCT